MKADTRLRRAKRVLAQGQALASVARGHASSRSTGTRAEYKIKAEAADRALEILSERAPR